MKRAELIRDAAGLTGCGLVSYGAWLVYPPAGYMIGGLLLILGALLTTRRGGPA